jgi:hypothetical protein
VYESGLGFVDAAMMLINVTAEPSPLVVVSFIILFSVEIISKLKWSTGALQY